MQKLILTLLLIGFIDFVVNAQKTEKYIKEKNVERIIKTLSADNMMGRSALRPEHIDKAASFIESEFRKIGLTPLTGQSGYHQEFMRQRIQPGVVNVQINNQRITTDQVLIISDRQEINASNGLAIRKLEFDSTALNKDQYFRSKAFGFIRDTSSMLVLIDPRFESNLRELKSSYKLRLSNNRKYTKVFVIGLWEVERYSINAIQKVDNLKMANVVGKLEGKTKPDEIVIFSGHYDHIGIQKSIEGDSIANGADDDASGTVAVIELARYFKKLKNNQRTIIFVAFTAEEIGGFGSRHFSEQLNPDKVMAMFNIEMIGKPSMWGPNFAFITGYERSDVGEILQKNLEGTPFQFKPDPYPKQNLFYRSDNATMARMGVPAHSISTDQIDNDKFYHTVNDEVETLDMKNITATIRAIALSSISIVNGTDTPRRIDKSQVR